MGTTVNSIQKFERKTEIERIFEENKGTIEARKEAIKEYEENKRIKAEVDGAKKLMNTIKDNAAISMVLFMAGISILGSLMMTLDFLATIKVPSTGLGMLIVGVLIFILYSSIYLYMFEYIVKRIVKKKK